MSLDYRTNSLHSSLSLLTLSLAFFVAGCGGAIEPGDANCNGSSCGNVANPGVGGAATTGTGTTVPGSGGSTTVAASGGGSAVVEPDMGDGGSIASGGSASIASSVVLTQDVPETTADNLTGVSFSVARPSVDLTEIAFYSYAAVPPTRASETNFCGNRTLYVFTCETNLPGCLTIEIYSSMTALATFIDTNSELRYLTGYVNAVRAPLAPLTEPPEYSFIGNFEFSSTDGSVLSIKGNFSVRFDNTTASYIIIC
jgi:hypothetical protein